MTATDTAAAAQDASAEAPDVAPAKPARKPTAAQQSKIDKAAAQSKRTFVVTVEGVEHTVEVPKAMTDAEAEKHATKLVMASNARKSGTPDGSSTPDVERDADADKPAPKPRGMQLASGEVKVRLSKTAFEALGSDAGAEWRAANPKRWRAIKGTKPSRFGSTVTFYFPVSQDEGKALIAWLRALAKKWDALAPKDRAGSPKPLIRNADLMKETLAEAKRS